MYKRTGDCWHITYHPTFKDKNELPAIRRSRTRLKSKEELSNEGVYLTTQQYYDYLYGKRAIRGN